MADLNSRVLDVSAWVPAREWQDAPKLIRDRYVRIAADILKTAKLKQILRGIGADGKPLKPRKHKRADGADGPPLSPHDGSSRSPKWARATPGYARGTVTIWWSHGWGRILGYHARGEVPNAPVRNILDFPPNIAARVEADCRNAWQSIHAGLPHAVVVPKTGPVDLALATFHSADQRNAYAAAVAAGLNRGPNRGDRVRTGPRLIQR